MSVGPNNKKQYGLILPTSKEPAPARKTVASVFNVASSDEDCGEVSRPSHLKKNAFKNMKRQARIDIQTAMEEDPTVYQYDELYDNMKEEKAKVVLEKKKDKTSKYAKSLLRNAALRKLENDRHFEKKCARELREEGNEFADKESFVTSSYKAKLAELAVLEAEHKRMEEEDAKNDVTKKSDLSAFYKNILDKRTETKPVTVVPSKESSDLDTVLKGKTPNASNKHIPIQEKDPGKAMEQRAQKVIKSSHEVQKTRSYRKRSFEKTVTVETNTDSGEDTPDEKEDDNPVRRNKTKEKINVQAGDDDDDDTSDEDDTGEKKENEDKDDSNVSSEDENEENNKKTSDEKETPKIKQHLSEKEEHEVRIKMIKAQFKMRNTPESIDEARRRYFQRLSDKG